MIIIEGSVVFDWFREHKKTRAFLFLVIFLLLIYYLLIRDAIINYNALLVLRNSLNRQLIRTGEIIEDHENTRRMQGMKLAQIEKEFVQRNELNTSSMSVSEYYRRCRIKEYSIRDDKGSSSGGQGRPALSIGSTLNYDQVFCVFSNFSKSSNDVEFKGMTLSRDENKGYLKWILDIAVSD